MFASALGLTAAGAESLRGRLLEAALTSEAAAGETDRYGQRFVLDFEMSTAHGTGWIRSIWMVRTGEDFARLVTCYVL